MTDAPATAADHAPLDEAALLRAARAGDVRAFESLYRALAPSVYGLCLRISRNAAEAQDCTQDTFVRAWQLLADFRGDSRLGTWLHRIAVNEVLGRRRHRAVEHRHLSAVDPAKRYTVDDSATLRDLEAAIERLPDRAREVFVLRAVYGYSHDEIARMLEVTVSTSKSQHHRARKLLVALLPGVADSSIDDEPLEFGPERIGPEWIGSQWIEQWRRRRMRRAVDLLELATNLPRDVVPPVDLWARVAERLELPAAPRSLEQHARKLATEVQPPADLWPRIVARLDATPRTPRRLGRTAGIAAAFAVTAAAAAVFAVVALRDRVPAPGPATAAVETPPSTALGAYWMLRAPDIDEIVAATLRRELVLVRDERLRIEAAIEREPDNLELRQLWAHAYRTELELADTWGRTVLAYERG